MYGFPCNPVFCHVSEEAFLLLPLGDVFFFLVGVNHDMPIACQWCLTLFVLFRPVLRVFIFVASLWCFHRLITSCLASVQFKA